MGAPRAFEIQWLSPRECLVGTNPVEVIRSLGGTRVEDIAGIAVSKWDSEPVLASVVNWIETGGQTSWQNVFLSALETDAACTTYSAWFFESAKRHGARFTDYPITTIDDAREIVKGYRRMASAARSMGRLQTCRELAMRSWRNMCGVPVLWNEDCLPIFLDGHGNHRFLIAWKYNLLVPFSLNAWHVNGVDAIRRYRVFPGINRR